MLRRIESGCAGVGLVPFFDGSGVSPGRSTGNGVCRVGTHSRFGFGELRVRPASDDRVPDRAEPIRSGGKPDVSGGEVVQ